VDGDGHLCVAVIPKRGNGVEYRYSRLEVTQGVGGIRQLIYAHATIHAGIIYSQVREGTVEGTEAGPCFVYTVGQHGAMCYLVHRLGPYLHNPFGGPNSSGSVSSWECRWPPPDPCRTGPSQAMPGPPAYWIRTVPWL
jgi:hypothetical protein